MTTADLSDKAAFVREALDEYRPITGFRNRVVHLYDRIDPAIVYRIVTEDRPDLSSLLQLLLGVSSSAK